MRFDDLDDPQRCFDRRQAEPGAEFGHRSFGGIEVDPDTVPEDRLGVDAPEDDVGIRHGRFRSSPPVAGRAGNCPCASGPDPE